MYMVRFNPVSISNLIGKIIDSESYCPAKPKPLSCKGYTINIRPCGLLGGREYLRERFPMQPDQTMGHSERELL